MYLPPNTTALIQPLDQGVIMAAKQWYTCKYLDEVLVVIPEEEDEIEDTRGLRTLQNIKTYNLKLDFQFRQCLETSKNLHNGELLEKLLQDVDPELDFEVSKRRISTGFFRPAENGRFCSKMWKTGWRRTTRTEGI